MIHAKLQTGEQAGTYVVSEPVTEAELLTIAQRLARRRLAKGRVVQGPKSLYEALQAQLLGRDHEVFCLVYLDTKHRILGFEELFRGTIDGTTVAPREVVKQTLAYGATAVVAVHNHPSGELAASPSDRAITERLQAALSLIDVQLLDHVIVSPEGYQSLSRQGRL